MHLWQMCKCQSFLKIKNKANAEVSKMQSEDSSQTVIWKFQDLKSKNIYSPVQKKEI